MITLVMIIGNNLVIVMLVIVGAAGAARLGEKTSSHAF